MSDTDNTPNATETDDDLPRLEIEDGELVLPDWLVGYVGKFTIRTPNVTGDMETTDHGMGETSKVLGAVPEAGDYHDDLEEGQMAITTPGHPEVVYEIVHAAEDDEDPTLVTDGGQPRNENRDDDTGRYAAEVSDVEFVSAIRSLDPPTTMAIAEEVGLSHGAAYRRLKDLGDDDRVYSTDVSGTFLWHVNEDSPVGSIVTTAGEDDSLDDHLADLANDPTVDVTRVRYLEEIGVHEREIVNANPRRAEIGDLIADDGVHISEVEHTVDREVSETPGSDAGGDGVEEAIEVLERGLRSWNCLAAEERHGTLIEARSVLIDGRDAGVEEVSE